MLEHIPVPKAPLKLPTALTQEEVQRMIEAASHLLHAGRIGIDLDTRER